VTAAGSTCLVRVESTALDGVIGEHRSSGERKYYLTNLPASASLRTLTAAIKARRVCEQAHQQMKEELGLDHFEGRS
jgi:SRSO17 transposase